MTVKVLWFFVLVYGLMGLAGILFPVMERKLVTTFTRRNPVRILGLSLVFLGIVLFVMADATAWKKFVQVMGVLNVIAGGVNLLLPDTMVVVNEAWIDCSNLWHRVTGLAYLVVAYLFYVAASVPPPPLPDTL